MAPWTPALAATSAVELPGPRHDEILLRTPDGHVVGLRLGATGPVAIRGGVLKADTAGSTIDAADVEWWPPTGDAVYLDEAWWSPLATPVAASRRRPDAATLAAIRDSIAPADDGHGADRLYGATVGDATADGALDLVVSFRRPFRRNFINVTRPARAWRDKAGMSAHLGVYDPGTLRERWVAGTLVHPVVDVAVCDGSLAVSYGRLDRRGVIGSGAWRWQGFGFLPSVSLPGPGRPRCVDLDGDGRLEPAILGRERR